MKIRKRILAAVLTAIMTISMLPANTFATETVGNGEAESAVEAVSVSTEEQDVETTVEDVSEDLTEETSIESSETDEAEETADPAAEETTTPVEETVEKAEEAETADETEESSSVTLKAEGDDYVVTVTYDAAALLPEGTDIKVKEIKENARKYDSYCEEALEAVQKENEDAEEISYIRLFDITLVDAEGKEVQPEAAVDVKISLKDVKKADESTQVVHFGKEETEVIETEVKDDTLSFAAEGFSIYAVIGTGNYERLTVNFYGADTNNPIDTMYVKKADQSNDAVLQKIIYDPGAGTIPVGSAFYGWSIDEPDYSVEAPGKNIDEVRTYIKTLEFSDGDVLNIYAMLVSYYRIDYIDPDGINLGSDRAMVKTAGDEAEYTVNMNYSTDDTHNFEGWLVSDGLSHISDPVGATPETVFVNKTNIKITGDVQFSVSAPEGHWLIFNENGKHATYNAPRFVKSDDVTSDENMLEMVRKGYTFAGWYTGAPSAEGEDPTGDRFDFGHKITETTTIYAKWIPETKADYTVIIWKEGLAEGAWDFEESIVINGDVGTVVNTVQTTGSGNDRYARINNVPKQYKGFSYDHHDTNVIINAEGNTLVNVYYKRNTYTLRFWVTGYFTGWPIRELNPITAKYGEDISSHFPMKASLLDWPSWFDVGSVVSQYVRWNARTHETFTEPVVYIDTMPAEDITFDADRSGVDPKAMYYYIEALPGESADRTYNGKNFILYEGPLYARYNYFTESEDFKNIAGTEKWDSEPGFDSNGRAYGDTLRCYYTRQTKYINFKDGAYFDGNDVRTGFGNEVLGKSDPIPFNSDITLYNKGKDKYFEPKCPEDGYVLEGWYVDQACTYPYTFNRMSSSDITVYAKWRQIQYRVFLRPNAGTDPTLTWGSDDQATNFRVTYGEKVSPPEGMRTGYRFYGWYLDEGLTQTAYLPGLVMNDTTVTAEYDKEDPKNFTDPSDRFGNTNATSNADVERFWITRKFDLFAKWGKIVIGANGIGILYDANGGSGAPSDTVLYQDNTTAITGAAPKAPEGKVFKEWVVQKWNGTEFVPTDVTVLPGQPFDVNVNDAKIVDNDTGNVISLSQVVDTGHYTYTIEVKAEYVDEEEETPTHITWYKNDGSGESYRSDDNIKINEAVDVYGLGEGEEIPSREGFTFLGWTKAYESVGTETSETDLFITYDETNGYDIAQVAADEITPYEALYAVWEEKNEYFIYHHYVGGEAVDYLETCAIPESGTVNLAEDKMTGGYMYGGYWDYTGKVKGDPITDSGLTFAPTKHQYIYLKEVSTDYLKPNFYVIYNKDTYKGLIQKIFVMYDVDNADDYLHHYLVIDKTDEVEITDFASEGITVTSEGKPFETLTAKALFNVDSADMGFYQLDSEQYIVLGKQIDVSAYYVTQDNVKVTGAKNRRILLTSKEEEAYNGKPTFTGWKSKGGNTKIGIVNATSTATPYGSAKKGSFSVMRTMMIAAPSEKLEYTITKVYDTGTEEEIFEEGDYTGAVSYSSKDGYLFAGWYMDSAFTTPADFSNVNSDMTVYAKYVKKTDISVSFTRKSLKSGTAVFDAVVSLKGQSDLDSVTVNTKGSDAVLSDRTVQKSGSGKNIRYTTQYKGNVAVNGLSLIDSFTASVRWTTPDGTTVSGPSFKCTYIMGLVTVR